MNILCWNYRRLENQCAVNILSHLVGEKAPGFIPYGDKTISRRDARIQADLPYCCMFTVLSIQRSGGLALLWMEEVNLHVQTFSMNHIILSSTTLISPRG